MLVCAVDVRNDVCLVGHACDVRVFVGVHVCAEMCMCAAVLHACGFVCAYFCCAGACTRAGINDVDTISMVGRRPVPGRLDEPGPRDFGQPY